MKIEIKGFQLESGKSVNFLRITIDHNLTLDTHISNIYKTVSAKVKTLSRIRNAFDEKKKDYYITLLFCHSLITIL